MPWYVPVRGSVFWEELRRRLRGGRGQMVLLLYGLALVVMLVGAAMTKTVGGNPRDWPAYGASLWRIFLVCQLAAMLLLSPGMTANAISIEREQGTLEMLFLTPLSTLSLVLGKFFGAIGQLLTVVLSGLPVISVVFLFGGVSPGEVTVGYALILATAILYASLGFLASCLCARSTPSMVWAYSFMMIILVGLPLALLLLAFVNPAIDVGDGSRVLFANPIILFYGMSSGLSTADIRQAVLTMLIEAAIVLLLCVLQLRRLRGLSPVTGRRLSMEDARLGSRFPLKG